MQIRKKGWWNLKKSSLKLLSQSHPNFAEMILRWSPFKFVSVSAVLYPRWPPLLKIEISSNCQNCSILSQKVPKFELYMHSYQIFNIYYGIFLWTLNFCLVLCLIKFGCGGHLGRCSEMPDTILEEDHPRITSAKFGLDWHSSFREDFFLNFIPPFSNLHNRSKSAKVQSS
jgi:hypothetical protein